MKSQKSLDDLKFGKGPLEPGMVGLVTSVSHDGKVEVDYGFRPKRELTFLLSELEPVFTGEGHWKNCPIQVGLPVRVKKGISEPSCQWGNLKQGVYPLPSLRPFPPNVQCARAFLCFGAAFSPLPVSPPLCSRDQTRAAGDVGFARFLGTNDVIQVQDTQTD